MSLILLRLGGVDRVGEGLPGQAVSDAGAERDAICGWLTVSESRTSGTPDTIRLPIATLPAIGEATEAPVVYIEGGPGGATLPAAAVLVGADLTREHEMIVMGQRGSAYAEPSLTCEEVDRFTVGSTDLRCDAPGTGRRMVRAHEDCRRLDRQGADIGAFTLDRFGISGAAGLPQLLAALRGEAAFPRPGSTPSVEHRGELPLGCTINEFAR